MERMICGYGVHVADAVQCALHRLGPAARPSGGGVEPSSPKPHVCFFTIRALERFSDALIQLGFLLSLDDVTILRSEHGHPSRHDVKSWIEFIVPADEDVNVHAPVRNVEIV